MWQEKKVWLVVSCVLILVLVASCAPAPAPTDTPSGTPASPLVPSEAEKAVERAKIDLAQRRGIAKEKIVLIRVGHVDWPDTSLGCPEPGKVYAQVITPGYRILLSDGQEEYEYHSDKENNVVYCQGNR